MGERRGVCRGFVGKPKGKVKLGSPRKVGNIILRRYDEGVWTGSSWLRIGTGDGQF
jgi:hypothetical protein